MLGADHHGYIARLKAAAAAFGDDPDTVEVMIGQMVNLVRDGQAVKMSKRAGTVITLDDLVEAIGVDAARYSLVRSSVDQSIDIDLALWASASSENPVYYVQYAHARLSSIARNAADLGLSGEGADLALLTHDREGDLIRTIGEYPRVVAKAAELREPHRVARYLEELAGTITGSTTRAASCRWAMKSRATCIPRAWPCAPPHGRFSPTDSASSASAHRSGCERASRGAASRRDSARTRPPATTRERLRTERAPPACVATQHHPR